MNSTRSALTLGVGLLLGSAIACSSLPPPRAVYRDLSTAVELRADPQAGLGHSHPVTITPEQMTRILSGVRVQKRGDPILSAVTGQPEVVPAFSAAEVQALAPHLSHALAMASPQELVTFYRRYSDASLGLGITSGGLFVQDHALYLILANYRNRPSDVMSQAVTYEVDPVDDPLLSLKAMSFSVSFSPPEAGSQPALRERWRYVDPGKVVVVDLERLQRQPEPVSSLPSR